MGGDAGQLRRSAGRAGARDRDDLPGARPRRRAERRGQHLPRATRRPAPASPALATRGPPARALLARLDHPKIRPTREVGILSAAGSRSCRWPVPCPATPGSSSWTSRRPCSTPTRSTCCSASSTTSRASGAAIIYISHRLEEIRRIGDRLTVLKDGRTVATDLPARDHAHVGAHLPDDRPHVLGRLPAASGCRLRPRPRCSWSTASAATGEFSDVSFGVRPGEILGVAGSGRRRPQRDRRDGLRRAPGRHRHGQRRWHGR